MEDLCASSKPPEAAEAELNERLAWEADGEKTCEAEEEAFLLANKTRGDLCFEKKYGLSLHKTHYWKYMNTQRFFTCPCFAVYFDLLEYVCGGIGAGVASRVPPWGLWYYHDDAPKLPFGEPLEHLTAHLDADTYYEAFVNTMV